MELRYNKQSLYLTDEMVDLIDTAYENATTELEEMVVCMYLEGVFVSEATSIEAFEEDIEGKVSTLERFKDNTEILYVVMHKYTLELEHKYDLRRGKLSENEARIYNTINRGYDEILDTLGVSDEDYHTLLEYANEYLREEGLLEAPW